MHFLSLKLKYRVPWISCFLPHARGDQGILKAQMQADMMITITVHCMITVHLNIDLTYMYTDLTHCSVLSVLSLQTHHEPV